jgi:hypothetical protein
MDSRATVSEERFWLRAPTTTAIALSYTVDRITARVLSDDALMLKPELKQRREPSRMHAGLEVLCPFSCLGRTNRLTLPHGIGFTLLLWHATVC